MKAKIWAVIPAHNEEKIIKQTIQDLLNQTLSIDILIVADNCNDKTIDIVKQMQQEHPEIELMETVNNKSRKAGAINQALHTLSDNFDAVLLMDADTRIDSEAVETAWSSLYKRPKTAAVCSKAGVLPYKGFNPSACLLHRLQRLEYSVFDSQRVETLHGIKVVHGMAALHRWKALKQVGFYDEGNLVEDYDLTIRYKKNDWEVTVNLEMKAWTTVPTNWRAWWKQRLRWNRGGIDTLKKHGWGKATKADILQHFWMNILILFHWFFLIAFILMVIKGNIIMHALIVIAIVLGLGNSIYRLSYLEDPKPIDLIFRITILPEMIYSYVITLNWYHAYFLFLLKKKQSW